MQSLTFAAFLRNLFQFKQLISKMKKIILTFAASIMLIGGVFSQNPTTQKMDSVSYSLGVLFAQNFKTVDSFDIDATAMSKGFADAIKGKEAIDAATANQLFSNHMSALNSKKFAVNIGAGKAFLDENGKRAGVTTTASGLQYEVVTAGTGPKPAATDKVTVHYEGKLLNGKVFDSSIKRGQPIDFPVNGVIQGWQEALQLMPVGSKWKLFIPSGLAYGERGAGGDIGPHETLVFDVELIKINQ
jgi:FKBP-type peptidyl-prolyl cis-trans isomerase FklB